MVENKRRGVDRGEGQGYLSEGASVRKIVSGHRSSKLERCLVDAVGT